MNDIRTLCEQHAKEMTLCGYVLARTINTYKSECDKCKRVGFDYYVK